MDFNIGETLFEKLRGLVSDDRVYPDILTYGIDDTPAYLVYKVDAPDIERNLDGTISHADISVSVECYEKEKDAVRTLAQSVIDELDMSNDNARDIALITFIGNSNGYITDDGFWYETLEFNFTKIA